MITVAVLEDEAPNQDAITAYIETHPNMRLVGAYTTYDAFKDDDPLADVVVSDLWMRPGPGRPLPSLETHVARIGELAARTRVVVYTIDRNNITLAALMLAGAYSVVDKTLGKTSLLAAVEAAAAGVRTIEGPVAADIDRIADELPALRLTPREIEIVGWRALNLSYQAIADHIAAREGARPSVRTIEKHIVEVRRKVTDFLYSLDDAAIARLCDEPRSQFSGEWIASVVGLRPDPMGDPLRRR